MPKWLIKKFRLKTEDGLSSSRNITRKSSKVRIDSKKPQINQTLLLDSAVTPRLPNGEHIRFGQFARRPLIGGNMDLLPPY
jgi:hypothetical protein